MKGSDDSSTLEDFRRELQSITKGWTASARIWERDGFLPAECFHVLGEQGVFERRWSAGRTAGVHHARILAEEMALIDTGLGLAVTLHCEVFLGVLHRVAAHDGLRDAALAGQAIGCFAITEPRGGSDVAGVTSTAARVEHGWHLVVEKRFTSNVVTGTHVLLLARHDDSTQCSLFVVPLDDPTVVRLGSYEKLGTSSCDVGHFRVDGVVPESALVGRAGAGLLLAMEALMAERIAASCQMLAVAWSAWNLAAAWMRRREQFGSRLADHQALRHRMADAWGELTCVEALLDQTLDQVVAGVNVSRQSAALKLRSAAAAQHVIDESLQMLGGRGYLKNFPLERWYRDVRLARIGAGTDEIMRELIARQLDRDNPHFDAWIEELVDADLPTPPAHDTRSPNAGAGPT